MLQALEETSKKSYGLYGKGLAAVVLGAHIVMRSQDHTRHLASLREFLAKIRTWAETELLTVEKLDEFVKYIDTHLGG